MASDIDQVLGLIDRAEATLQKVRTETSVGYQENESAEQAVDALMLSASEDLENAILLWMPLQDQLSPADAETFSKRNGEVRRMFSYLSVEQIEGRLPQLKEVPWPPSEWVAEDNMRADAAEAAAEPATNGYEEVPSAQGAGDDTSGG